MKKISILILLFLTVAISAQASRSAPEEVMPVEHKGIMYVVLHWGYENGTGQNGGYIEARDKKTQKKIWGLQVYKTEYRPELETDVQDIFITDIQIDKIKQTLKVKNEADDVYHVYIKKRAVAIAENDSSRRSVEKLLELTEASKMMHSMKGQISNIFSGMSEQMGISEKDRAKFEEYMQKASLLVAEEMNWETFKEPMIDIYMKHFSEQEIQSLIEFYSSDIGRSMIKKMPLIMQDSMLISQEIMKKIMPKFQELAMEMQKDVKNQSDSK